MWQRDQQASRSYRAVHMVAVLHLAVLITVCRAEQPIWRCLDQQPAGLCATHDGVLSRSVEWYGGVQRPVGPTRLYVLARSVEWYGGVQQPVGPTRLYVLARSVQWYGGVQQPVGPTRLYVGVAAGSWASD